MSNFNTDRQHRSAKLIGLGLALLVALALIWSRFAPPTPQQPAFYRADPTPVIIETTHIEVFSRNQLCVGINVCN